MTLKLNGSSSGYTAIDAPASAGSNTLVLPTNNGTAGQVLQTDGNGNLTWVTPTVGLTTAQVWRRTGGTTIANATVTDLDGNWEQSDTYYAGQLGTAMSHSGGIFSFPSTGFWLIRLNLRARSTSANQEVSGYIKMDTDGNGTWEQAAEGSACIAPNSATGMANVVTEHLVDITNTTVQRVQFRVKNYGSGDVVYSGDSSLNTSYALFMKLAET